MLPSTAGRWGAGLGIALLCMLLGAGAVAGWLSPFGADAGVGLVRGKAVARAGVSRTGAGPGGALMVPEHEHLADTASSETPDGQRSTDTRTGASVTVSTRFYDVEGTDARSLLASLGQHGPLDADGTWAASTSWAFRWSYQPAAGTICRVETARVELDLTYTYPRWSAPASATPTLLDGWQRYLALVELHEQGHREIAEAAADDLVRALEGLPAQPSCPDLAATARDVAGGLLARHAQAQTAYDHDTAHGATQGAVLSLER